MKVVDLRDRSQTDSIQITPKRALGEVLKGNFEPDEVIIIQYRETEAGGEYEFWQGGGCSNERILWHLSKYKQALLEEEIDER